MTFWVKHALVFAAAANGDERHLGIRTDALLRRKRLDSECLVQLQVQPEPGASSAVRRRSSRLNEVAPCKSFISLLPSSLTSSPRIVPVRGRAKHSCKRAFMATGTRREKWSKACSPSLNGCGVIKKAACGSSLNS